MQCGLCGTEIKTGFDVCSACGATKMSGKTVRRARFMPAILTFVWAPFISLFIAIGTSSLMIILMPFALPAYLFYKALKVDTSQDMWIKSGAKPAKSRQ